MQKLDKDALICDFAEVYHIYDYRGLPARYAAVLACGLGADSRIMKKKSGIEQSVPLLLLQAHQLDAIRFLIWSMSGKKSGKPDLISEMLMQPNITSYKGDIATFKSGREFENARKKIFREQ